MAANMLSYIKNIKMIKRFSTSSQPSYFSIDCITAENGMKTLFSNLGISLFPNSVVNIIGENGSGKTTLLNIIASFDKTKQGKIILEGEELNDFTIKEYSPIFYHTYKSTLKNEISVMENLKFWASIYNSHLKLPSVIAYFNLEEYLDFKVKNLSTGWQKKISLARLMLSNSMIWLLDEPFSNLDDNACMLVDNLIRTRASNKGIIIFTSHAKYRDDFINIYLKDFNV